MRHSIPLAFLLLAPFAAHAAAVELKPTTAVYAVARDGKVVGDAHYSLAANGDGSWTLESTTKGSAGMAKLVGLDVPEQAGE